MRCLYCGRRLALLRKLTDGEFCSSAHRQRFLEEEQKLALARLVEEGRRVDRSLWQPGPEAGHGSDPRADRAAGFRTEEFNAKPGRLAPVVRSSALEQPLHVCLVERTDRTVLPRRRHAAAGTAVLPYDPGLSAAGPRAGLREGPAQPIPTPRRPFPAALPISPVAVHPPSCGLRKLASAEPREPGRLPIRRPRTSVFLKLARPAPPTFTGLGLARPAQARPLSRDTPAAVEPPRGVRVAIEPADFGVRPAGVRSADAGLRTTGIPVEAAPAVEPVANGRLAPEVGLAALALAAEGAPVSPEAPSCVSFIARPAPPAGRAVQAGCEPPPAAARVDLPLPEVMVPARSRRRRPAAVHDAFGGRAARPVAPLPRVTLLGCPALSEIHAPPPVPPGAARPGAVPNALAFSAATEVPSSGGVFRLRPASVLCPLLAAVEVPDPTGTPHWGSPGTNAEPLPPPAAVPCWDLSPPDASVAAGRAAAEATELSVVRPGPAAPRAAGVALAPPMLRPVPARLRLEPVRWSSSGRKGTESAVRGGLFWSARLWMAPSRFWAKAPADLKWLSLTLPAVLVAALVSAVGWIPSRSAAPGPQAATPRSRLVRSAIEDNWVSLQRSIGSRAAINLQDDFRSGLADWEGPGNWGKGWDYDSAGFVLTGPMALYRPSLDLGDYRFEFLGQIEKKSLNWVFRAADYKNYYAMKIVLASSGPLPKGTVVHYAVIDGRPERVTQSVLPMVVRADTFFRVRTEVRGANFTTLVQDKVVDFWSDDRLTRGGVGFFSDRGERARLRWVEVSHQYDTLGRLCALLAPHPMPSGDGSLNRQ
jgi:hypothetical protein